MSGQRINAGPAFTTGQYSLYVVIGIIIWITGVIIVRLLGPSFFIPGSPLIILLFAASIPLGAAVQYSAPLLTRLPMKDTLIPVFIMITTTLMCDGVAIAFTDIYSADTTMKMMVGGWLLWTFGLQCLMTILIVNRANNQ